MTLSARTHLSLNMSGHKLGRNPGPSSPPRAGVPAIPPVDARPRCKNCGGLWNGSGLLFCDVCEDAYLDLMRDTEAEEDLRESDREVQW